MLSFVDSDDGILILVSFDDGLLEWKSGRCGIHGK
jgi:hypothetical protein